LIQIQAPDSFWNPAILLPVESVALPSSRFA